jgi:hypothetical protein
MDDIAFSDKPDHLRTLDWLSKKIRAAVGNKNNARRLMEDAIRAYWNHPHNVSKRSQAGDSKAHGAKAVYGFAADWWMPGSDVVFDDYSLDYFSDVVKDAKINKVSAGILRDVLLAWMEHDGPIPEPIRKASARWLNGEFPLKGRRGVKQTTGEAIAQRSAAFIVDALHRDGKLSLSHEKPDSAYAMVESITGIPVSTLRKAYRKNIKKT